MRDTSSENAEPLNIKGEVEDEGVMCGCVDVQCARPNVWANPESRIQSERNYKPRAKPNNE